MNRTALFHLSIFTLIGFPLVANIVLHFSKGLHFMDLFQWQYFTAKSIGIGFASGVLAAILGLVLLRILPDSGMDGLLDKLMSNVNPQWYHILFYSFCAGVGEEILFRGALQYYFYLWPTAVVFVAIHGYLNPKDKSSFIYGIFLIFIAAGFGYLFKFLGIFSAISAHFMYDVIMFFYMKKAYKSLQQL